MAGEFILERLKEKFGDDEEEEEEGFPDMNYLIGNSSAMDVGEFPTPMDERIGYASMTGGNVMELQITNPATFSLERDAMVSTIHQLGLNVTTHPDMNAGFCTAEKSARGEEYGYETIEQYFTDYLQELAQFKKHVERQGPEDEPLFEIGRMNPHISTSPMPSLEERMANDVGVGPFGYEINKYDEDSRKKRNYKGENIYKNSKFLRRLYHTLFLELADYPFQQYQTFASYSDKFNQEWLKARHKAANNLFEDNTEDISEKVGVILTARRQDQGVNTDWLKITKNWETDFSLPIYRPETGDDGDIELQKIREINNLNRILRRVGTSDLQRIDNILLNPQEYVIRGMIEGYDELPPEMRNQAYEEMQEIEDTVKLGGNFVDSVEKALEKLWNGDSLDQEDQYISQDAKWSGLQSHLDIEQIRLFENSYRIGRNQLEANIEKLAEEVFCGKDPEEYFNPDERENIDTAEEMHEDLLERILSGQQFQREMWKESIIFYHIIPAWMSSSDVSNEDHDGWIAPRFIWKTTVEDKWSNRDDIDVDLDLEKPRNGIYEDDDNDTYHYLDLLEESDEFQRDVAAAVGACYAWAHFTQRKAQFDLKGRDFGLTGEEQREVRNEGWTWIRWMNRFGLGVNLETMQGSPQMRFKVWRPKDIAVTCHAINMTTREIFDEEELNEEIDGRPAKFTIDMEHVASLGAPPLKEMEIFVDQEEALAEESEELDLDPDKPVSTILRQMHLMDPGVEGQRGTHHGAFERGNTQLYEWLYFFVENGFARNKQEAATVLFELAEHNDESSYMMRLTMNMIELGVKPEELDPSNVSPGEEPEDEKEAMIARFFGMEQVNYNREWAKIEEHAFDPLKGLLEAEEFDYTFSSKAAVDQGQNRPQEWQPEEYQ